MIIRHPDSLEGYPDCVNTIIKYLAHTINSYTHTINNYTHTIDNYYTRCTAVPFTEDLDLRVLQPTSGLQPLSNIQTTIIIPIAFSTFEATRYCPVRRALRRHGIWSAVHCQLSNQRAYQSSNHVRQHKAPRTAASYLRCAARRQHRTCPCRRRRGLAIYGPDVSPPAARASPSHANLPCHIADTP